MPKRIMTIYGTRPEAIKVAPIIKAIDQERDLENIVVVTGQHREMLDQVNTLLDIEPHYDLNLMSANQTLNSILSGVISGIDSLLDQEAPDAVIVQGDTSSVVGAAFAAFNRQIPVIHVEAGLRSGDLYSPFPEEANRRLTTQITDLHLAPTQTSKENLLADNVVGHDIVVTGNTVIDTLLYATRNLEVKFDDPQLEQLHQRHSEGTAERILLVTAHRRENHGSAMEDIGNAVAQISQRYPELTTVLPLHKNPKVRQAIRPALEGLSNVIVVEPLAYAEFARVLAMADVVLTDSGGVQEEAPSLGKPVLVMRENTERPEAVVSGTVKLVGTSRKRLVSEVTQLLDSAESYAEMANAVNPYGDGTAARRTIDAIRWKYLDGARPEDFNPHSQ